MTILETIHHKKNEIQEVESFKDAECTKAFDFTNAKNLYIELVNGDITVLLTCCSKAEIGAKIFIPYLPFIDKDLTKTLIHHLCKFSIKVYVLGLSADTTIPNYELTREMQDKNLKYQSIKDITPNLSKYIPEDNAVLFLSEEDKVKYTKSILTKTNSSYMVATFDNYILCSYDKQFPKNHNKATIFLPHGTQSEIQKANVVAKELRGKYGVEEVNLFALHWFIDDRYTSRFDTHRIGKRQTLESIFNKSITTNSTGILKPEDSTEHLQVIDCKEIFEEYLSENNLI